MLHQRWPSARLEPSALLLLRAPETRTSVSPFLSIIVSPQNCYSSDVPLHATTPGTVDYLDILPFKPRERVVPVAAVPRGVGRSAWS